MIDPAQHSAEEATPAELWRASVRLLLTLAALAFLVVPFIRDLPLGPTTRMGILAWLLVLLALYWLYAGMGIRPLLLIQLVLFSGAAAFLSTNVLLVAIDVHYLSILRRTARVFILVGAGCAGVNLGVMVMALIRRWPRGRSTRR